jgi:hypothetical protein
MASNYGELKEEVRAYLYNRKDLTVNIPQFIKFGEHRIFRQLRCRANEATLAGDLSLDSTGFSLPDNFLEMKFLLVNSKPLERISDIDYLSRINIDNAAGEPTHFARVLNEIKIWRQADSDYTFNLVYWQDQIGDMVNDEDTTPVLTFAPDLYLYAALIEAMPFLVKDDRLTTWQALFQQCIDGINFQTTESEYAGSPVSVSSVYSDPIRGIQSGRRL